MSGGTIAVIGGAGKMEKLFPVGTTALMVYALLETGVSPQDPKMVNSLKWLGRNKTNKTYSIALRASAYAAACKFRDTDDAKAYRKLLAAAEIGRGIV